VGSWIRFLFQKKTWRQWLASSEQPVSRMTLRNQLLSASSTSSSTAKISFAATKTKTKTHWLTHLSSKRNLKCSLSASSTRCSKVTFWLIQKSLRLRRQGKTWSIGSPKSCTVKILTTWISIVISLKIYPSTLTTLCSLPLSASETLWSK